MRYEAFDFPAAHRAGASTPWRPIACLCLFAVVFATAANAGDFAESPTVADAKTFGWTATAGAELQLADEAKVGHHAVRAVAGPEPKPYMGLRLHRPLDLSGAEPGDSIVFYVKGNIGGGLCLNMRMAGKHIYRYATIVDGQWNRVEMDLDLSKWTTELKAWGQVSDMSFYSRSFDRPGQFLILDGLIVMLGGKELDVGQNPAHAVPRWQFPYRTDAAWYLGDGDTAWAISTTTGQIVGAWNASARARYVNYNEGRYHLETILGIVTGREKEDRATGAEFDAAGQRIVLACENPSVPELAIRKTYRLDGRRLFKEVVFTYRGEKTKFVTYNSETAFTPDYREGGYYMGAGFVGPLVPAPSLSEWRRVLEYQNTSKGMLLHQPRRGFSFAQIRTRVDDKFVWPWFGGAIASYTEQMNVLHYTPDGWDMSLCTSRLDPGKSTSYEEYFSIVPGGWYEFLSDHYPSKPEVREALAEIPPVPEWMADVRAVCSLGRSGILHVRRLVEATDEGSIVVLVGSWGSWGDYYVEEGLVGAHGGFITGPELKDLIHRVKAISPRVKVGIYQWVLSASYESRILAKHPEWFRLRGKEGLELSTFPGAAANFAALLSIPECYDEMLAHFDRVLSYLDVDMIYLDDPKAVNMVDWHSNEYTRDDMSYRFFLDLRRLVAKHGPDKMLFFNCRGNPYADMNYIEARSQLRDGYWRDFAGIGSCIEAFLTCRPTARIVPLYWIPSLAREYVNRTLALGWIPSLTYGDVIERRPYSQASYEMGNSSPAAGAYTPDWKVDQETLIESYLTRRPGDPGYLLSLISHEDTAKSIPVTIDLDALDLDRGGTIVVWDHVVADATRYQGRVTERLVKEVYEKTGWRLDGVTRRKLLYMGPYRGRLDLRLAMEPLILHQLYITGVRAGVYAVDHMPCNYLFSRTTGVFVEPAGGSRARDLRFNVSSQRDSAQVIAYIDRGLTLGGTTVDGKDASAMWVEEGGLLCPVFTVAKGRSVLEIETVAARAGAAAPGPVGANVAGEALEVHFPGLQKAVVSVSKDDQIFFSRMAGGRDGTFTVPLSPDRPGGSYRVAVTAGSTADGAWWHGEPLACAVEIPAASVDLNITPAQCPQVPGKDEIRPVDRTFGDVHVFRTAAFTTPTPLGGWQPNLEGLTASADAETLTLEAGTTRKIMNFLGGAFAGFEIENLRKVRIQLRNTFHDAWHLRGRGDHGPGYWPSSRSFAGFVVDYHTAKGYTKRVSIAVGLLHPECSTVLPPYGKNAKFDEVYDLGPLVDSGPEKTLSLDLARYAPNGWDGRVWFSVGTDWAGSGRKLTARILAVNDAVTGQCLFPPVNGYVLLIWETDSIASKGTQRAAAEVSRFQLRRPADGPPRVRHGWNARRLVVQPDVLDVLDRLARLLHCPPGDKNVATVGRRTGENVCRAGFSIAKPAKPAVHSRREELPAADRCQTDGKVVCLDASE